MVAALLARFGLPAWLPWALLGVGVLVASTNAVTYFKATGWAEARCEAAALRAQLAAAQADLRNSEAAARVAEAASRTLTAEAIDRDAQIRAYEATLASRPPCELTPDDIRGIGPR